MVTELSGNVCLSDCGKCSAVPHDEVEKCRQRNLMKQCRQDIKELQGLRDKLGALKTAEEIYADRAAREPHRTANDEIGKAMREGLKGKKGK